MGKKQFAKPTDLTVPGGPLSTNSKKAALTDSAVIHMGDIEVSNQRFPSPNASLLLLLTFGWFPLLDVPAAAESDKRWQISAIGNQAH